MSEPRYPLPWKIKKYWVRGHGGRRKELYIVAANGENVPIEKYDVNLHQLVEIVNENHEISPNIRE